MFKFLKSKHGFTLVELMIVVVIMAILVAVAVPIYNAVTANAKLKTCVGNQREIVSQLNTYGISSMNSTMKSGTIIIKTNADGTGYASLDCGSVFTNPETFISMFQAMPFCPIANNTIKVYVEKGNIDGEYYLHTECYDEANNVTDHEYNPDET